MDWKLKEYEEYLHYEGEVTIGTAKGYFYTIKAFRDFVGGAELTGNMIKLWFREQQDLCRKPQSLKTFRVRLRQYLRWLNDSLAGNASLLEAIYVLERMKLPRCRRTRFPLSEQEVACWLARPDCTKIEQLRDRCIMGFCYGGARIGEAMRITRDDLKLEQGTCHLIRKGNKDDLIMLSGKQIELLKEYLVRLKTEKLGKRMKKTTDGRLFPFSVAGTCTRIKQYAIDAGLGDQTSHIFRHSLLTHLWERGALPQGVQGAAGHERLQTTEQYYIHASRRLAWQTIAQFHPENGLAKNNLLGGLTSGEFAL